MNEKETGKGLTAKEGWEVAHTGQLTFSRTALPWGQVTLILTHITSGEKQGTIQLLPLHYPSPGFQFAPNDCIRLLRSCKMENRGSKAWIPPHYQQPPFHPDPQGIVESGVPISHLEKTHG